MCEIEFQWHLAWFEICNQGRMKCWLAVSQNGVWKAKWHIGVKKGSNYQTRAPLRSNELCGKEKYTQPNTGVQNWVAEHQSRSKSTDRNWEVPTIPEERQTGGKWVLNEIAECQSSKRSTDGDWRVSNPAEGSCKCRLDWAVWYLTLQQQSWPRYTIRNARRWSTWTRNQSGVILCGTEFKSTGPKCTDRG